MKVPSRGLQGRFVEFFRAHVDELVRVSEHFYGDVTTAQTTVTAIFVRLWDRFSSLDPASRHPAVCDELYHRIWSANLAEPPVRELPYVPLEGEWSPLRPSDAWAATVLLQAAERANSGVDWPLLHLMVLAGLSTETWAMLTQRSLSETAQRVKAHQLAAHRAVGAAALELAGPDCAGRPTLADGATSEHLAAHWSSCVPCSGFVGMLVPTPRLIAGASFSKLGPADRQRMLNHVLAPPDRR